MSMTSLTTPVQLSVFVFEWNPYFPTSNQFTVDKTSQALYSLGSTSLYGSKKATNFRFTRILSTAYFICIFNFYFMFIHLRNHLIKTIPCIHLSMKLNFAVKSKLILNCQLWDLTGTAYISLTLTITLWNFNISPSTCIVKPYTP